MPYWGMEPHEIPYMPFTLEGEAPTPEEKARHAAIARTEVAGGPTPWDCCETPSEAEQREQRERYRVALAGGLPDRVDPIAATGSLPYEIG